MHKPFFIPVLMGLLALGATQAFAQTATVVMRNGDRVQAQVLDLGANFTFRINGREQQVPISEVVLIDFAGNGRNISADEISKANNASSNGFVLLRNGDTFNGRLEAVHATPSRGVFSSRSGRRDIELSQISRIYLGSVNNIPEIAAASPSGRPTLQEAPAWARGRQGDRRDGDNARPSEYERRSSAPSGARTVVVPSNVAWTNTGLQVARGQWLRFEPSGEVRLSFNGDDVATAAGAKSFRFAARAPIPTIPVGALIGRVNDGKPFSIGDTTQAFQMPANGTLFLGVNDDHVPDNSGNYVVKVWEP
jgi:hypothetical protein